MVKIAIAGSTSQVAQEIVDALASTNRHELVLLSRKDISESETRPGITCVKVDYEDPEQLSKALSGVHTVLSFVNTVEPISTSQRNLIDAAVRAGVKRFAPNEWATSHCEHISWYKFKETSREYLENLNKEKKVLEYTMFQPGLFMNYLTYPHISSKYVHNFEIPVSFNDRRALLREGGENDRITLTTVADLVNVVVRAVEFEGEWPTTGGLQGTELSIGELIRLGEKVRGASFNIEKLATQDLEAGTWKSSWLPRVTHPGIPPEHVDAFSKVFLGGFLLSVSAGAWNTSNEWNKLLPDYKFTQADEFLTEKWSGKP